ncbi:protein PHLOEM PROTEIN 2-LIKE A1-like [Mangifera indica]|uniref:protein PHLOEM PROTEIN 2-LIKE A1-like n=1 Tax=Mangifera indica TaxID=29780 RepID=UPI001CF98704|nr:protein PHLOEM PROTEIN 2-LIKE A1-like [Mangifera indica]
MASAQVQLPHNLHAILKEGESKTDAYWDDLIEQLHAGIFLFQNKLKFWVDRLLGANAFDIHARGLSITWGDDTRYWNWTYKPDTQSCAQVEMAELLNDGEYGFANHPVNFKLTIPNYHETIERREDLSKLPKKKWAEVRIGEFYTCCNMTGDMEILMFEHGSQWKSGMIVNKIVIRPVRRLK